MSKSKKSYSDQQSEINKLLAQQEAMKGDKLEIVLNEFRKAFKTKKFQEMLCNTDDAILKKSAKKVVDSFENVINNQIEREKAVPQQPVSAPQPQSTYSQYPSNSQ